MLMVALTYGILDFFATGGVSVLDDVISHVPPLKKGIQSNPVI
jgi:hypothetical protein